MTLRIFTCVFLLFSLAREAAGQLNPWEGKPISEVRFTPPIDLEPADLTRFVPLKKGELLHAEDVASAIDGLYSSGVFSDIVVEGETSAAGVAVIFHTTPQLFTGGVNVTGNVGTPPSGGQLQSATQFTMGAPFQPQEVANATDSLKRLLQANGFYRSTVTPDTEESADGQQVFIGFKIKAGKRAKYESPGIEGNGILSSATIVRATGWQIPLIHWWLHVSDARTRKGVANVQNKYAGKDRLTATVELGSLDYHAAANRVKPHLKIEQGPTVKVTAIEAKVSRRILKRYVPVFEERTVDTDLLVEGKRNLEDYFQSQGYYDVNVDFRVQPVKNDLETIEYVVARGSRHKVASVVIGGNKYFDAKTIRERMFIVPASFAIRHGRYSEAFRRRDEANIAELYKSNGFRDVQVGISTEDDFKGRTGDVGVTVAIVEGPQWLVNDLTVSGLMQVKQSDVAGELASIAGQPFAEVNMANDRDAVLTRLFERGFPSAAFKASWQPVEGMPDRVNIRYEITEGRRQYVRRVITAGNHTTRQSLIDKNITLKPGEPLSAVTETDIQKRFYDLGVFARVDTAIQNPDGATDYKYVLYNFQEANRYTLNVGLGAQIARIGQPGSNSLGSPAGSTGFSPEFSVDVSRLNFLGIGHTVSLRTVYSNIEKKASISYLQPRFMDNAGRNISYTLLYENSLDVRTFQSKREEASVQISQKFSKSLTGLFRVAYRRVSVGDVVIPVLLIPQLTQPVRIGIVSGNLVQDRRNNPVNPSHGMYNTIDIALADKVFGSQRNFGRALLRNATYYRLTDKLILARQTQFGLIAPFSAPAGLSEQESVPLPERFFGGGADSLRAFAFNQAGPRDTGAPVTPGGPSSAPTGFPLGGNALFFNNVEVRFPLLGENLQGVFFHDMGNVYSSLSNISFRFSQRNLQDFDYAAQAVGFGVRYRTPVGPIRLDLSYVLNSPNFEGFSGTPVQLLQCNPNSTSSSPVCTPTQQNTGHFQFFFSIGQTF